MSDINSYWKKLVSTGLRFLQDQRKFDAVSVIKNAVLEVDFSNHDNWNYGTDYWDLIFRLKYKDYISIADKKDQIESDILTVIDQLHIDGRNGLANVLIQPTLEPYIDWNAALPATRDSTINLICEEQKMLNDVATGVLLFKQDGVEEAYQERHSQIISIASRAGFDYPITANTLAEWWGIVRTLSSYAERREYISKMISPLLNMLRESEDNSTDVSFQHIITRSETIQKAVEDAEVFMREGRYDSVVDRVHTAFHGYLRTLLSEHNVAYGEDDGLPGLFTKLHVYYRASIKPLVVADRVRTILRSAGGMINAVNELRNNNTIAHPNGELIQAREARLVIRLVNAVVDYIEDVETQII